MHSGTVARWNSRKGFGFLSCGDFENDVFVHVSSFGGGELIEGANVTFDVEVEPNGKQRAINVVGEGVDPSRRPQEFGGGFKGGSKGGFKGDRSFGGGGFKGGNNNYGGGFKGDRPRYESNNFGGGGKGDRKGHYGDSDTFNSNNRFGGQERSYDNGAKGGFKGGNSYY